MCAALHATAYRGGLTCRHAVGDRWFVDQRHVKVNGIWRYGYRAVDQHGQVIDVIVSERTDIASARRFFATALTAHGEPVEVITDRAPALAHVIEQVIPAAFHNTGQYANNRYECDHDDLRVETATGVPAGDRTRCAQDRDLNEPASAHDAARPLIA